jgi:hypothetical protein
MPDSRARVWFALFVLVVFCAGAAAGIVIGRHVPPREFGGGMPFFGRGRGPGPMGMGGPGRGEPPALPPHLVEHLASELQLDDAQTTEIRRILDERRDRLDQVHREAREKFDQEQRGLHEAIRAVLRPDQREKFDRMTRGRP